MIDNDKIEVNTIQLGRRQLDYALHRDDRERLKVVVTPRAEVVVYAPLRRTRDEIETRLRRRSEWILRQHRYFAKHLPRPTSRRYVSGETVYYLGRQYRVKLRTADEDSVKLKGRFLLVSASCETDAFAVGKLVQRWYAKHARSTFARRLDICMDLAARHGIEEPHLRVRQMKRRWGSSNGRDSILLNSELVKAPVHCVDYVIMHELAHLKQPDHSPKFFALLARLVPDWEDRKIRLEEAASDFLAL